MKKIFTKAKNTLIVLGAIYLLFIIYYMMWGDHTSPAPKVEHEPIWEFRFNLGSVYTMPQSMQDVITNELNMNQGRKWTYDESEAHLRSGKIYTRVFLNDVVDQHFDYYFVTDEDNFESTSISNSKQFYNIKNCIETGLLCDEIE